MQWFEEAQREQQARDYPHPLRLLDGDEVKNFVGSDAYIGGLYNATGGGHLHSMNLCLKGDDHLPTVYERVKSIVVEKLGVDEAEVTEGASFVDNLNADSLDLVELIMAFEEEFSEGEVTVEISDEEAGNIATINDAVNYLKELGVADT